MSARRRCVVVVGSVVALALCAWPAAPARACVDCVDDMQVPLGVSADGLFVVASEPAAGDAEYRETWTFAITRGAAPHCTLRVGELADGSHVTATGAPLCESLAGLRPDDAAAKVREYDVKPALDRPALLARAAQTMRLSPLSPTRAPRVTFLARDGAEQPIAVGGVEVARLRTRASRFFVRAYKHARVGGGLFLRVVSLMSSSAMSTRGCPCEDAIDRYVFVRAK
jgi:hypothetical protein